MSSPRCQGCGSSTFDEEGRCRDCREFPTLGYGVIEFIESSCVIPDRDQAGEPFVLTDEQARFVLRFYRVRPNAPFDPNRGLWRLPFHYHRGAQLTRPQKWGKGPFAAALICAEGAGPVVFDGWDANGAPVGRPWSTPLIQVTAVSEDQTDNVWSALVPMIELGDLGADIPDTGETRINLPGGGRIVPVTSSARSRLGQRITFIAQDQTESWTKHNGGRELADNQRRNIAGMGGRWVSTPNAWDPSQDSVAQYTAEHEHDGVLHDDVDPPESLSLFNKADRRKALKMVYGDSWWVDLDRIETEVAALIPRDPAQAARWFLNRKLAGEGKAFNGDAWDARARVRPLEELERELVVLGIDGARFRDALAIVATDVETGYQWPVGIWERPDGADDDYEHPFDEVDGAVTEFVERFELWRAYVDPQNIEPLLSRWQGRYGDSVFVPWYTNRPKAVSWAVRNYQDAIGAGDLEHDGDPIMRRHIRNAVRQPVNVKDDEGAQMHTITKDRPNSPRKVDAAMAGLISWEARLDAIAAGAKKTASYRVAGFR